MGSKKDRSRPRLDRPWSILSQHIELSKKDLIQQFHMKQNYKGGMALSKWSEQVSLGDCKNTHTHTHTHQTPHIAKPRHLTNEETCIHHWHHSKTQHQRCPPEQPLRTHSSARVLACHLAFQSHEPVRIWHHPPSLHLISPPPSMTKWNWKMEFSQCRFFCNVPECRKCPIQYDQPLQTMNSITERK